jgi:hypothetical protein
VTIEGKVTGGYPNRTVFLGFNLAIRTREKRVDINPIVPKARMAEHCDIVPFKMIGDTRIDLPIRKFTAEKHMVRADWLEPGWIFVVGSQTRRVLWQRHPGWFIRVQ